MSIELRQEFDLDSDVLAVKCNIKHLLSTIGGIKPDNEQSYRSITSIYAQAKNWQKLIETHRKEATSNARHVINTINDKAKEFSEPLDQIIQIANAKTAQYLAIKQAELKAEQDEASMLGVTIPQVMTEVPSRGEGAMAYTRVEKKFRVTDISKVPVQYLMLNEEAVDRDVKLGIGSIPGIVIYEETKVHLRTR
jgi:hypothetical protein